MTERPVLWGFTLADFDRVIPYSGLSGPAAWLSSRTMGLFAAKGTDNDSAADF
jgi:hypothetical protein